MNQQPLLSAAEWDLVLELLTKEQRELPHEIHHTDSREVRRQLEDRLEMVNVLANKLRKQTASVE